MGAHPHQLFARGLLSAVMDFSSRLSEATKPHGLPLLAFEWGFLLRRSGIILNTTQYNIRAPISEVGKGYFTSTIKLSCHQEEWALIWLVSGCLVEMRNVPVY